MYLLPAQKGKNLIFNFQRRNSAYRQCLLKFKRFLSLRESIQNFVFLIRFGMILTIIGFPIRTLQGSQDTHVKNEEFVQIQRELKSLRAEIAQFRKAITEIHRKIVLPQPTPALPKKRLEIILEVQFNNNPVLGSEEALVGIVEFSDF